jgi:hypothetical protein
MNTRLYRAGDIFYVRFHFHYHSLEQHYGKKAANLVVMR